MENVTNAQKGPLRYITPDPVVIETPYIRPADWLPLPTVSIGDQKAVGLFAVYDAPHNFLALIAEGAYQVDWGDGSAVEEVATGVQAEHDYSYAAISASTLCSRGYKQVVVTITPQTGADLTKLYLSTLHASGPTWYGTPWLDIKVAGEELLVFGVFDTVAWETEPQLLEQFEFVGTNKITDFSYMFEDCYSLTKVVSLYAELATTMEEAFGYCAELRELSIQTSSACLSFAGMFYLCTGLREVPLFDTSGATDFHRMFYGCPSIREIPLFDTALGTSFVDMFYTDSRLGDVPLLDLSAAEDCTRMFYGCYGLHAVPAFNLSSLLNATTMFQWCDILEVPYIDIASITDATLMFDKCRYLMQGALLNTSVNISYASCFMDHDALVAVFTGLATVVGKTITITGNPGVADLIAADRLIATNKGWTIVE